MCAKAADNPLDRHEHQIFDGRHRLGDGHAFQRRNFQRQCHRLRDCHRNHLISVIEDGMSTWRRPSAWMAWLDGASTWSKFMPSRK